MVGINLDLKRPRDIRNLRKKKVDHVLLVSWGGANIINSSLEN
jgi:hypothetical protein